jgi:hypothetical protein
MTVRWNPVAGVNSYEVYLGTDPAVPPELPAETTTEIVTVLLNLTNKAKHFVWIKAVNEYGKSDYSPPSYGTPWPSNEVPETPDNVVVTAGMNQLNVRWGAAGGGGGI